MAFILHMCRDLRGDRLGGVVGQPGVKRASELITLSVNHQTATTLPLDHGESDGLGGGQGDCDLVLCDGVQSIALYSKII